MNRHILYNGHTSRKIISLLLVTAVGCTSLQPALASSRKSQAQNAKKAAESSLNSVNSDISSITSRQQALQQEINALDAELVELLVSMGILSDELELKDQEIKQANKDLKAAQKEEADQYESMKKRIRNVYVRGDNSMIEVLLGATSMSDFLNRVNYYNAVYDYDREQLEIYKETKQQVIDLKSQLLTEQSEMEEMQENYKLQEADLKTMVAQKESTMDDFASQLSQAKILAAEYKETIEQQNQIIRDEEEKERIAREAAERAAREAAAAAEQAAREAAAEAQARAQAEAQARAESAAQAQQSQTGSTAPQTGSGSTSSAGSSSGSSTGSSANTAPAVSPSGATGSDVINYATQFIGNPYVWGGTSLTNGADCSGFVMSVYAHFGYSLPHSSAAMAGCGRGVSYSEAQPGDLICYSGHVALYMGGGRIVGAQSSRSGITTANATYRTIIAVRRIIN